MEPVMKACESKAKIIQVHAYLRERFRTMVQCMLQPGLKP